MFLPCFHHIGYSSLIEKMYSTLRTFTFSIIPLILFPSGSCPEIANAWRLEPFSHQILKYEDPDFGTPRFIQVNPPIGDWNTWYNPIRDMTDGGGVFEENPLPWNWSFNRTLSQQFGLQGLTYSATGLSLIHISEPTRPY